MRAAYRRVSGLGQHDRRFRAVRKRDGELPAPSNSPLRVIKGLTRSVR